MTFPHLRKIITKALRDAENQALDSGVDVTTPAFKENLQTLREGLIIKLGFIPSEYEDYLSSLKDVAKQKSKAKNDALNTRLNDLKTSILAEVPKSEPITFSALPDKPVVHSLEDIGKLIDTKIKSIPVPKESKPLIKIERPVTQITQVVEYNDSPIKKEITTLADQLKTLQEVKPHIFDIEAIKSDLKLDFGARLKENINILGMPDFRKLAMGLQGQIDVLNAKPSGGGTPGGSDTQVQFNDAGAFAGDSTFTFNKTTKLLTGNAIRTINLGVNKTINTGIAAELFVDGATIVQGLRIEGNVAGALNFNSYVTGDSQIRFTFLADGTLKWGSGSAVTDLNLYRAGVGILKTDNGFQAGGSISAGNLSGTNTGDVTVGAFGSSPTANALSLSGQVITAQPADATHPGDVSTTTQTFAGSKTLSGAATTVSGTLGVGGTILNSARISVKDNGIVGNYVFESHTDNDDIWSAGFFNDSVSTTVPVFEYFGWNSTSAPFVSGDFEMGTPGNTNMFFYTNGYTNPRADISGAGVFSIYNGRFTTKLVIPNGVAPTVTAAGAIGLDTTDKQLLVGDGSNAMVMAVQKQSITFVLDTPVSTDVFPIWQAPYNVTMTKITATVKGGTSVTFNMDKRSSSTLGSAGTSALTSSLTATTTGANSTTFSSAGISAGSFLVFVASALSGTVNQIVVEIDYTIDRT